MTRWEMFLRAIENAIATKLPDFQKSGDYDKNLLPCYSVYIGLDKHIYEKDEGHKNHYLYSIAEFNIFAGNKYDSTDSNADLLKIENSKLVGYIDSALLTITTNVTTTEDITGFKICIDEVTNNDSLTSEIPEENTGLIQVTGEINYLIFN